ncbi:MAG: DUF6789 family protein [Casimicrobiaceae bacterium]
MDGGNRYFKGMAAGLVATVVLSAIMLVKANMGIMPELDVIKMLSTMLDGGNPAVGWAAHFMIGTVVLGLLFAAISRPGLEGYWWRGVLFGIGAWFLMMVIVMPMAGAGVFGLNLGIMTPVMTLMLHLIYGVVLGAVYGALLNSHAQPVVAH